MTPIVLTGFAADRHFTNVTTGGTKPAATAEAFMAAVNEAVQTDAIVEAPGFAPFVKHVFVPVDVVAPGTLTGVIETEGIEDMLKTGYETRREGELPYLTRWFPRKYIRDMPSYVGEAIWLDLVCYSKAQLKEEGMDIGDADWGIVSINSEPEPKESPPTPATLVRNAMGIEGGGNGVPVDPKLHAQAVEYWTRYAIVR